MWDRTGFRGMTIRNWLALLIIPLALTVIGFYFSAQQDARQQQIEDRRSQDAILQAYLDEMGSLMLNRDLRSHDVRTSEEEDTILTLARARTTTTIRRLDAEHNRSVTRFLTNVGLTGTGEDPSRTVTDPFKVLETQAQGLLYRVDLQGADLAGAFLPGVDLTFTELQGANLSDA
jgi:uncharacterized protein YjbI with pentapeptide repeats